MKQLTNQTDDSRYTADDRLHFVHYVTDENGNKMATVTGPLKVEFRLQDLVQLVAGACVMAMPIALTEEVWNLGEALSIGRTLLILIFSIFSLAAFIWGLFCGKHIMEFRWHFLRRAVSAYLITFCVAFLLLFLFDKAPLHNLKVAFTRTIIVAFPASFAATAVDFLK
jgi:uncharacterized membrane protein